MVIFELSRVNYPRIRLRFVNLVKFEKYYVCVLISSIKNGFGRNAKASRILVERSIETWLNVTKGCVHNPIESFRLN